MPFEQTQKYELVLLGATGYTGKLCAEYIARNLPTDLRWAIAGRSSSKLSNLLCSLQSNNVDRPAPDVLVVSLNKEDLNVLVKKTTLLINTVGPYHLYSGPVVEACANNGTHYLDVTGEAPWVLEMIEKHHTTAENNGAIIIPEIGLESAPSDMLVWSLANLFRKEFSLGTKEVIGSLHQLNGRPSGGTMATILTILEAYGPKEIARALKPWAMSPIPGPRSTISSSFLAKISGVRTVPGLGVVTNSFVGRTNAAIVSRSWGLLDKGSYYGPKFNYKEYITVRNALVGVIVNLTFVLGAVLLAFRPVRWLLQRLVYAPGEGESRENTRNEFVEFRAIATADEETLHPRRASARFLWKGGHYYLAGILLAEAAMVILRDREPGEQSTGGILTPATLKQPFIDRMRRSGIVLDLEIAAQV